ncbi:hypothetical protein PoB_007419500 [Plakobranchus ocellatus]|uniref:Uncharacterized protein n=1 Tax=Plakobranchus ocellatus TaxID=259542 RepID=A0AAV4DUP6_9GAST|nr:hypothetical protein PoB_007419500 [Plakobranchus ocellatus]
MANRPNSSGPDSSAGSSADLPAVSGLNKMGVLPEEWTLPHEWKIEKRERFDNWKLDVQSQISNISQNLKDSLQEFPHPEVGSRLQSADEALEEWRALQRQRSLMGQSGQEDRGMQYGLSRSLTGGLF